MKNAGRSFLGLVVNCALICAIFFALGMFVGCSVEERKDILADVSAYVEAPVDAPPAIVVAKIVEEAASKASSPVELIAWAIGLGTVALTGWLKRKFIVEKYKATKDLLLPKDPPIIG